MSDANTNADDGDDVRMRYTNSKTTNLVVYLKTEETEPREVAVDLGGEEYAETETERNDSIRVQLGDNHTTHIFWGYSDLPRGDTGEVTVFVDRDVEENYIKDTGDFTKGLCESKVSELLSEVADSTGLRSSPTILRNDDWETKAKVRVNDLTTMGLIHHKPDVEQGEVWDDEDAEMACFTVTVECKETSENTIHNVDEVVVEGLRDYFLNHDAVKDCRYRTCETETKEQGDCYGVFN